MTSGQIDEISQTLGRIEAKVDASVERMTANHEESLRERDWVAKELSTIKHDQRNLEQQNYGNSEALKRIGDKLRPLEDLPAKIDGVDRRVEAVETVNMQIKDLNTRMGAMENLSIKLAAVAATVSAIATFMGYLLVHFGGYLYHSLFGKS